MVIFIIIHNCTLTECKLYSENTELDEMPSTLVFHCPPKVRLLSVIQLRDADPMQLQARQSEATVKGTDFHHKTATKSTGKN